MATVEPEQFVRLLVGVLKSPLLIVQPASQEGTQAFYRRADHLDVHHSDLGFRQCSGVGQ